MSSRCRIVLLIAAVLPPASAGRAEDAKLERHVYRVADLIAPRGEREKDAEPAASAVSTGGWSVSWETRPAMEANELIRLLTSEIEPPSWSERGGPGTVEFIPLTESLVVNQSPEVQDQIADMLAALRRTNDLEVEVEVKFALISDEIFQCLKREGILDAPKADKHAKSGPKSVVFLDEKERLRLMEALPCGPRTKVMQAPKVVVANGRIARISKGDSRTFVTGLDISQRDGRIECHPKTERIPLNPQVCLRPIISTDRHIVQLQLDVTVSNLASGEVPRVPIIVPGQPDKDGPLEDKPRPITQYIEQPQVEIVHARQALGMSDRSTIVMSDWQRSCVQATRTEVPILGDIPYVGELFRKTQYHTETVHLLILVTSRIVGVQEEKKQLRQRGNEDH